MKSKKFAGSLRDGEPIYFEDGIGYFACCDCGLVHMMVVTPITLNDVEVRFFRNNQRSFNRRKYTKYPFKEKK